MTEGRILYDYHFQPKKAVQLLFCQGSGKPAGSPGGPQDSYIINAVNIADGFGRADIRAASGGAGLNLDYVYEYVIYVRKKDYQRAEDLLRAQIG